MTILRVDASARRSGSFGRPLLDLLVAKLVERHPGSRVVMRDLADGVPLVDAAWVAANNTPERERAPEQAAALATSDMLVSELKEADVLVIGCPIYNFGVSASLNAWIDQICRARLTFSYTENGPKGLLIGKRAVVVVTSGGTVVGSPIDFATGYLRHVLGFVGISDVTFVAADRLMADGGAKLASARDAIDRIARAT